MDLEPNSDEQQLIDTAHSFLMKGMPAARLHGADAGRFTEDMRSQLAELGWYGLGLSEEMGGFGFTIVDEVLLFREIGRQLAPLGVLNISLAAKIAAAAGDAALVGKLISGEIGVALAVTDPNRKVSRVFEWHDASYAAIIDASGARLVELSAGAVEPAPCLDRSVTMGFADLSKLGIAAQTDSTDIDRIGRILSAAMLVGASEAMTDMIVEYAKIRETFGRPIGAYQAVRHPCADMAVSAFTARAQLFFASVCLRDGRADAGLQTDAAKVLANEAALQNADKNIQLHGGIATTDEHDAHLYLKRTHLVAQLFGGSAALDRILEASVAA